MCAVLVHSTLGYSLNLVLMLSTVQTTITKLVYARDSYELQSQIAI